jgi:hypothetical protein
MWPWQVIVISTCFALWTFNLAIGMWALAVVSQSTSVASLCVVVDALRQLLCAATDLIDPYALPCYVNEVVSSICLVVTSAGYSLRAWRLYDRFKCTSLIANGMRKIMGRA